MIYRRIIPIIASLATLWACSPQRDAPRTLLIAHSNDMRGEIRSCGCSTNDMGGLGRRATFVETVRDTAGNFLLVDAGDFFSAKLNYGKEKADLTLKSLAHMRYDAVVVGEKELGFGLDYIAARAREVGLPIVAANLLYAGTDSTVFAPTRELTLASGLKVGIVGVIGQTIKLPPQVIAGTVTITDPVAAANSAAARMRERVDVVVALAHMPYGEVARLAQRVEGIDVVVSGHDGQTPRRLRPAGARCYVVQGAAQGRYMGMAFATLDESGGIRTLEDLQVPLVDTYTNNEAIEKLFRAYDLNIAAKENASVPPAVLEARARIEEPFVGADACEACHSEIFEQWTGTKHAHAFEILTNDGREHDRDCTPCHTTGFYKLGGFESLVLTPELVHIQCEACHGNGFAHSEDPEVATGSDATRVCTECHTAEQTPDFDFETFWERIHH